MAAVLFDLDGTLINSIHAIVKSWVRAGNKMGVQFDPNLVRGFIGFSPRVHALKYFKREDIAGKFLKIVQDEFSKIWMDEVEPYPDSYTVLKSLRDMKIKTAVISSNFKRTVERILERFDFLHFLDAVVCDDEVERGKPAPDIVLEATKRLKVPPHICIVVGDTLFDVEAGKRAGAHAILVVRKPIYLAKSKYLPNYVIPSLKDIISIIKTWES